MTASEIIENLFVGDFQDALATGFVGAQDVFILCVLENKPPDEPANATWIPILIPGHPDGMKADKRQLDTCAQIIDSKLNAGMKVLTHCGAGIERSPLTVAWYLHYFKGMSFDDAYALLREKRPIVQDRQIWLPKK